MLGEPGGGLGGFGNLAEVAFAAAAGTAGGVGAIVGDVGIDPDVDALAVGERDEAAAVVGVDALLIDLTTMNEVPCYLQTPGYPFLPEYDLAQLIALIPEDPLPGGHLFRVHIQAWVDHELWGAEWDFTTRD